MSSHEDSPVPSRFGDASPLFLVYGARGWLGGQLTRVLRDASIPYIEGTARADDRRAVEDEIRRHTPTNVVSLIGRTHGTIGDVEHPTIDYLEQPGKFMLPKRRFWNDKQKMKCAFSIEFSTIRSPNRVLTPLKSASKVRISSFVHRSKIFVWEG
jgi:hypothetical protein